MRSYPEHCSPRRHTCAPPSPGVRIGQLLTDPASRSRAGCGVAHGQLSGQAHFLANECARQRADRLKAYNLAHQTFTGAAELDGAIHKAVEDLNRERATVPLAKPRISA
jgi:hypothetical protein